MRRSGLQTYVAQRNIQISTNMKKRKISTCKYCHRPIIWRRVQDYSFRGSKNIPIDEATGQRHDCNKYTEKSDRHKTKKVSDVLPADDVSDCPNCAGVVPDSTGVCMNCGCKKKEEIYQKL